MLERLMDREPIRRYQGADEALMMLEFQSTVLTGHRLENRWVKQNR